jgi:hypothetical protein
MIGAPVELAELLTECDASDIRLLVSNDGELTIDAPEGALTLALVARLKANKASLLALLRPTRWGTAEVSQDSLRPLKKLPETQKTVCRCGSTTWRDVPVHDGQSIRRDCGQCGRFLDFPLWHDERRIDDNQ